MTTKTDYAAKLKDPRWQKKRLEVFERDGYECQRCHDVESTLHVHHLLYEYGKNPWEYELDCLSTICEECHEEENRYKNVPKDLLNTLKQKFMFTTNLQDLLIGFHHMKMPCAPEIMAAALQEFLEDQNRVDKFIADYINNLRLKRKKHGKN